MRRTPNGPPFSPALVSAEEDVFHSAASPWVMLKWDWGHDVSDRLDDAFQTGGPGLEEVLPLSITPDGHNAPRHPETT
jgi:hypothetical protein